MTWLFSFKGRISRGDLMGRWMAVIFVTGMAIAISATLTSHPVVFWSVAVFIAIPGIVALVSLLVRRLHDRNRSGWWLLLYSGLPIVVVSGALAAVNFGIEFNQISFWVLAGAFIPLWLLTMVGSVEIWMMTGTPGPNRYGDRP